MDRPPMIKVIWNVFQSSRIHLVTKKNRNPCKGSKIQKKLSPSQQNVSNGEVPFIVIHLKENLSGMVINVQVLVNELKKVRMKHLEILSNHRYFIWPLTPLCIPGFMRAASHLMHIPTKRKWAFHDHYSNVHISQC